jgi:membrane protease subunit HflK
MNQVVVKKTLGVVVNDNKDIPELDEAIRMLQAKLDKFFGGGGGDNNGDFSSNSLKGLGLLAAGGVVIWGLSGFYIVDEGNYGVETRFGRYIGTTQAGLNWRLPSPIDHVTIVNVKQQRFIEAGYRQYRWRSDDGRICA